MKFIVVILVLTCFALVKSQNTTIYGNIHGKYLDEIDVFSKGATSQNQVRAFSFPTVSIFLIINHVLHGFLRYFCQMFFFNNTRMSPSKKLSKESSTLITSTVQSK